MPVKVPAELGPALHAAERVLVATHLRADGDAIGSLLALGLALQTAGKQVQMVSVDGIPQDLRHLEGSAQVQSAPEGEFDFICTVDCSDRQRAGLAMIQAQLPDLNVDHHITNTGFARFNIVEPAAVATAEILAELLPAVGLPLTPAVVAALLTGLITDTIGFRTSNMTPQAMRLAADLMEQGGNLPELYRRALGLHSFEAIRYWGKGLDRLERQGRLAWATLTLDDRKAVGYPGRDDADLINELAAIRDIDIAVVFVEQSRQKTKVSWRAQPGFDVSKIAVQFGGGGHAAASGAEVTGEIGAIRSMVLAATEPILNRECLQVVI